MENRQEVVMEISDQIRRAEYRVDPDAVAEAILARIAVPALRLDAASECVLVPGEGPCGAGEHDA